MEHSYLRIALDFPLIAWNDLPIQVQPSERVDTGQGRQREPCQRVVAKVQLLQTSRHRPAKNFVIFLTTSFLWEEEPDLIDSDRVELSLLQSICEPTYKLISADHRPSQSEHHTPIYGILSYRHRRGFMLNHKTVSPICTKQKKKIFMAWSQLVKFGRPFFSE